MEQEQYYNTKNFEDYKHFFDINCYDIKSFVEKLNFIVENENIICDIYFILKKLKTILNDTIFKYVCDILTTSDGCYVIYILFNIILDKKYDIINEYISPISNFVKKIVIDVEYGYINIMKLIYKYMNNDYLNDMLYVFDTEGKYQSIDIKKISNIDEELVINLITIPNINMIQKYIHNYHRIHLFYRLIYCISHNTNTNKENAEEDFLERIDIHIDDLMKMYNYFEVIYYEDMREKISKYTLKYMELFNISDSISKYIHKNIPCDYSLKKYNENCINIKNSNPMVINIEPKKINKEQKYNYINDLLFGYIYSINTTFEDKFKNYLNSVLDYDYIYQNDKYNLLKYFRNTPFVIGDKLKLQLKNEINFIKNINFMNKVLINYNDYNYEKNCEFKAFLENICNGYKNIYNQLDMDIIHLFRLI